MKTKIMIIGFVLLFVAAMGMGCTTSQTSYESTTSGHEAMLTEENQDRLLKTSPPPKLTKSLERENLIRRLELLNDENKIFYIYLIDHGVVMAEYTCKGKVSSVNSKLTTQEQIVDDPWGYRDSSGGRVVESPDLDGSYGSNGDAIFFFTSDGAYIEWPGVYHLSDFPLKLTTQPILVREI